MLRSHARLRSRRLLLSVSAFVTAFILSTVATAAGEAKGTVTYESKGGKVVVTVKHAYLVKGPDLVTAKTMRRVVLSVEDVGATLRACEKMMCSDGGISEGMTIDFDVDQRLNYWFVANGQRIQYSGTADPALLKLTTDTPQRLAGKWDLDARSAGGPLIQVEFDAELVKEIKGR